MPIVEKKLDGFLAAFQASLRFEERPLGRLRALRLEAILGSHQLESQNHKFDFISWLLAAVSLLLNPQFAIQNPKLPKPIRRSDRSRHGEVDPTNN